MTSNTADPVQPTPSTVVVATDGSVTVTQVSNATTVTWPGVFVPAATVPAQVGTVTPTAGNAQVGLSWSAPDDGGSAITDYSVQYSTDDATWSTFAHGTTATTATVTGLTNDTLYYFRVAAINAIGTGAYSASVTATPEVPFSPLDLSPTLWVDASDTSTITESGGSVSQWDDKSGNNNDVYQGTGAAQPTTGTRTLNSLNVIEFDGGSDYLTGGDILDVLSGGLTVFIVAKVDDDTRLQGLTGKSAASSSSGRYGPIFNPGGGYFGAIWHDTASRTVSYDPGAGNRTNTFLLTQIVNRNNSNVLRLNGAQVAIDSNLSGTSSYDTSFAFLVGAYQNQSGQPVLSNSYLDGFVAEIIVMNATATAQQISDAETYLADKWGITL